jgi:sulfide:quinone oxidoreductase
MLIAAPGIKLDWGAIDGLPETLGKNGVTSNYRFDLAPYRRLVQEFRGGRALFTQPPCRSNARARRKGALPFLRSLHATVEFHNSGAVLFGVNEFVPALMEYIEKYGVALNFNRPLA